MTVAPLVAALFVAFAAAAALAREDSAESAFVGEVVDLHCYLTRAARGAEHAGCANACIGRGCRSRALSAQLQPIARQRRRTARNAFA
jgi:hypothetical protein